MKQPRSLIWLGGVCAVVLLGGCHGEPTTQPSGEIQQLKRFDEVTALADRLRLTNPHSSAEETKVTIKIYDRSGKVVTTYLISNALARTYWRRIRDSHSGRSATFPSGFNSGTTRGSNFLPAFTPFADTTVTVEIDSHDYTVETASTSSQLLIAVTDQNDVAFSASWISYIESGDSTIATAATIQEYDQGYLKLEANFPSGALEELNDDLVMAPDAGPQYSGDCFGATLDAVASGIEAAAATALFVKFPNVGTYLLLKAAQMHAVADFVDFLCECFEACAETAPPAPPAWSIP